MAWAARALLRWTNARTARNAGERATATPTVTNTAMSASCRVCMVMVIGCPLVRCRCLRCLHSSLCNAAINAVNSSKQRLRFVSERDCAEVRAAERTVGTMPNTTGQLRVSDPGVRSQAPEETGAVTFLPYDRPVRAAFIGLGRIYDLNVRGYLGNPDVEVVALVDPSDERRAQRQADWPGARAFASAAELASSGIEVDLAEVLLPIPLHADGVVGMLGFGWHVNMQKPMCNDLVDAQRMLDAAKANDRVLRVMENYLFYEPLRKLKAAAESGEIGEGCGYHVKMVGTGRGGWDGPLRRFECQIEQMKRGG